MATRHIVSVKAVMFTEKGVVLLKNERDEWELPGGQLEASEEPGACVVREVQEELSVDVAVERLLDCWQFEVIPDRHVLIVAYHCRLVDPRQAFAISHEHKEVGVFAVDALGGLSLPDGYANAVRLAAVTL